jgi:pimeloyl-ACP methyl ester carboxylesterase
MSERRRKTLTRSLVGTGVALGAAAVGIAAERALVRRARAAPDPQRDEPLDERPGVEHRLTSFDGTELAVNVVGPDRGPTLVFIHGFSLDMTVWHYQWKRFARDYRCVLYDVRGHGRSAPAVGRDYELDALGHDLEAVLDEFAPSGPVVLVGHSMGGMGIIALADRYQHEFGKRVQGVVLANTAAADVIKEVLGGLGARVGRFLIPAPRRLLNGTSRIAYRVRDRALNRSPDLAFLAVRITNFGAGAPPSAVDHIARIAGQAPVEVWTDLVRSLAEMDLAHALQHITVPTLILVGDVDRLTPPSSALAMKERLPDARMVVLEQAGHCAMLERPDQFNEVVEGFLAEVLAPKEQQAKASP